MRYFILILFFFLRGFCSSEATEHINHLVDEESPYLQQHVHNPVDWYPWSQEAFEKAKREHKPIFLSIGYSTCHWCHVMEEESFENEQIAAIINRWFVPVKVDREQMPHLDKYFQRVYSLLNRRGGGWPLTIFLTEDLKPFFAATYIPPVDSYGVKGMKTVVPAYGKLYLYDRKSVERRAAAIDSLLKKFLELPKEKLDEGIAIANKAVDVMSEYYDEVYGGFGNRPKFPESSRISLLLDIYRMNGNKKAKSMALHTLDAMQKSGLYDQIEGAFFRYSVDRRWTMPHFEKMLYTNAELISLYTKAWKMTSKPRFKEVAQETIVEIDRRFRTPEGLYFSASDADTDGVEGGYFLFRYNEALEVMLHDGLSESEAKKILEFLDIKEDGNFDTEFSNPKRVFENRPGRLKTGISILKNIRKKRDYPFIDKKIITSWNAMMIKALFLASRFDGSCLEKAQASYKALLKIMRRDGGRLYHQTLYGKRPTQEGILEDYSFLADAALTGYETTLDERYLDDAAAFMEAAVEKFLKKGRWLLGESDVFESYADLSDSYYRSPLSVMINNLISLSVLKGSFRYESIAKETIESFAVLLKNSPESYPEALRAYLRLKKGVVAIKSSKENLMKNSVKIEKIEYPFILKGVVKKDLWLSCDSGSCFAYNENFEKVVKAIENR